MITCSHCGKENPANSRFCLGCGEHIAGHTGAVPGGSSPDMMRNPPAPMLPSDEDAAGTTGTSTSAPNRNICGRCGKENLEHYKFCLGCGKEIATGADRVGDVWGKPIRNPPAPMMSDSLLWEAPPPKNTTVPFGNRGSTRPTNKGMAVATPPEDDDSHDS